MKKLYLTTLICSNLILHCRAQTNQFLTNDVPINERGIRMILAPDDSTNRNILASNRELHAEQPPFWVFHNTSSNRVSLVYPHEHLFSINLKTTNGIAIPETEIAKKWTSPPKPFTEGYNLKSITLLPGEYYGGSFTKLTELFNFPSNGIYLFELRCWVLDNTKKQFVLSDAVKVRVIRQDTNSPSPIMESAKP